jgi:Ni/Fe-hydrogenase subunit HybB-like protein
MSGGSVQHAPIRGRWGFGFTWVRLVLFALGALGVLAITYRLIFGLGVATNLNDDWPWGLWVWWDVLTGVALAGGGYSTVLVVNFLGRERYRHIERAACLTSLIGYLLVCGGLGLDLGRWFNAWRPLVSWGYHSVMFELFICVSGYTIVQVIEFLYVFDERLPLPRIVRTVLSKIYVPVLIVGVVLPFLHQSALGSLYVIAKGRLDPLWWSMLLPLFFLVSSFYVGPAMVTVENFLSAHAQGRRPPIDVLSGMVRFAGKLMTWYLVLRMGDLAVRGILPRVWEGSVQSQLLLLEVVVGVAVPAALFLVRSTRRQPFWLATGGALAVLGVALGRANVVFTAMADSAHGATYVPSLVELAVTVGLISIGILAYLFVVENFPILTKEEAAEATSHVVERTMLPAPLRPRPSYAASARPRPAARPSRGRRAEVRVRRSPPSG